jgi:hypothetical protein
MPKVFQAGKMNHKGHLLIFMWEKTGPGKPDKDVDRLFFSRNAFLRKDIHGNQT